MAVLKHGLLAMSDYCVGYAQSVEGSIRDDTQWYYSVLQYSQCDSELCKTSIMLRIYMLVTALIDFA